MDEGLLLFMMRRIREADARLCTDANDEPVMRNGNLLYRLWRVGCRVEMREDDIAKEYGCSRSHVVEQIKRFKREGFIGNWGHGWYEFDASLCWRGEAFIRDAYFRQQLPHPRFLRAVDAAESTGPRGEEEDKGDGGLP